jgi:MFS family permease
MSNHPISMDSNVTAAAGSRPAAQAAAASAEAWPPPRQAWYAVGVFAVVLMLNFLDRGILTLLVEPIKKDLHLSDQQIALLIGFAFVCFYAVLGLPIARLVDSRNRRVIIGIGIATWSLATASCGLAKNFAQLFLARVGVGVGEACNGPATYSMMSDLFPPRLLPRAIAVLNLGFVAGTGIALVIGGVVIHFVAGAERTLPLLGTVKPWQLTFMIVGLPGVLIALLLATVKEPIRRGRIGPAPAGGHKAIPLRDVARFMRQNARTYGPMFVGLGFNTVLSFGNAAWTPTFFVRTFGWTPAEAGILTGIAIVCAAPFGLFAGSSLAEWFAKKGYADANLRVLLISMLIHVPGYVLMPLVSNAHLALALVGFNFMVAMLGPGPQNAALQIVTPNEMRGQVTALYLFVFNFVGYGLGPSFVAFLTDHFFGEANLRYSLSIGAAVMGPLAAATIWRGLRPYAESVVRARSWG